MRKDNTTKEDTEETELVEDDSQCGLCHRCKEWASPVYVRYLNGDDAGESPTSNCCDAAIEIN